MYIIIYYNNQKMNKYTCKKCNKEFTQKDYTKHITKKKSCIVENNSEEIIKIVVPKKINKILNIEKKYSVLSLFTGIGGMDIGFGGDVIVHKNSISKDFINNIKCNYEDVKDFIKLKSKMFNVIFK